MPAIKIGPPWGTVVDPKSRTVKFRLRSVCRFDEVKQLVLVEYFSALEQEQLGDANPPVQKHPRSAELYAATKDGRKLLIGEGDQAGLLMQRAAEIAAAMGGVPLQNQRSTLEG